MSTADVLVDLNTSSVLLDPSFEYRTHRGMLYSANMILEKLREHDVLDSLYKNEEYEDYSILVCGHSLGAVKLPYFLLCKGIGLILSYLLRREYKDVTCIAYSPPGCLISKDAIPLFKEFCTSVVLDDDLIPVNLELK